MNYNQFKRYIYSSGFSKNPPKPRRQPPLRYDYPTTHEAAPDYTKAPKQKPKQKGKEEKPLPFLLQLLVWAIVAAGAFVGYTFGMEQRGGENAGLLAILGAIAGYLGGNIFAILLHNIVALLKALFLLGVIGAVGFFGLKYLGI